MASCACPKGLELTRLRLPGTSGPPRSLSPPPSVLSLHKGGFGVCVFFSLCLSRRARNKADWRREGFCFSVFVFFKCLRDDNQISHDARVCNYAAFRNALVFQMSSRECAVMICPDLIIYCSLYMPLYKGSGWISGTANQGSGMQRNSYNPSLPVNLYSITVNPRRVVQCILKCVFEIPKYS